MSTRAVGERRPGWLTFAAVVMFTVCFVRIISGINYLSDGSQIGDLTNSVFGDQLWAWGIWDLCLAALALFAGLSLLVGGGFGRVLGYIWAVWLIVQSFLVIQHATWFALAMMTLGILVVYGLTVGSEWEEAEA